jgi:hypothetical protein
MTDVNVGERGKMLVPINVATGDKYNTVMDLIPGLSSKDGDEGVL